MDIGLTGKRISELEKSPFEISADTRFLNTGLDRVAKTVVKSYGLNYSVLSNQIYNDVKDMLHLSSMAYENKYSYSKITHTHDYDHVDAEVFYGPDSERRDLDHQMIDLGTIEISNYNSVKSLHICVPYVRFEKPKQYRVGEVKLVYISSDNVDYELGQLGYSPAYGWVIPNGASYSKDDYPDAYDLYHDSTSTETFRVPVISGFFRLNPGTNATNAMQNYTYHNSEVRHRHKIFQKAQLGHVDMSAQFDLQTTYHCNRGFVAHCGDASSTIHKLGEGAVSTGQIDLEKDVDGIVAVTGAKIFESEEDDTEAYPTHDTLVAVLYIGMRGQGQKVKIRFDGNGGTPSSGEAEYEVGLAMNTLPTSTKSGYVFSGWTTEATGGQQVDSDTIVAQETTCYAQYVPAKIALQRRGSLNVLDGGAINSIGTDGRLEATQGFKLMDGMEFIFKIRCDRNTDEQYIMSLRSGDDARQVGISDRRFMWGDSSGTKSGNETVGLSRDYWVKLRQTGNKCVGYTSQNGLTFTQDYQGGGRSDGVKEYQMSIGNDPNGAKPFCGSIDIGSSKISVNGRTVSFEIV